MATATLLGTGSDGWDTAADASYVTPSLTPGANCALALVMYGIRDGGVAAEAGLFSLTGFASAPHTVVSSAAGPSWTHQSHSEPLNLYDATTCIWTATIGGSDPGAFTVTIDFPDGRTAGQFAWGVYKVTGHDTTTPFAGVFTGTGIVGTGNGARSITLGATPAAGDVVLAISGADTAAASDAVFDNTARTWARDATGGTSGHQIAFAIGQSTGSTSTTVAWTDVNEDDANNYSSAQAAIIAVAGGAAAAGSASLIPRHKRNSLLRR